ncbi:MAG: peptidoglycan-binding protein [Candidatus Peribacteria bacterium]|nr:MAG: peptidoglycan-binding protein [Candidatus Peribacteria bacterium]
MKWLKEQLLANPHINALVQKEEATAITEQKEEQKVTDETKKETTNLQTTVLVGKLSEQLSKVDEAKVESTMKSILGDAKAQFDSGKSFGEVYGNGGAALTIAVQYMLAKNNSFSGAIDGLYGKDTKQAVRNFEKDNSLDLDDGWAGQQVISKLLGIKHIPIDNSVM